jgi:hypothetical protein
MPAQRTATKKAISSAPYYRESASSDRQGTPSLSSEYDDNDPSSDFELETPTKQTKALNYYEASDDEYAAIKPDLSDDEGIVKPEIKTPSKSKAKGKGQDKAPGSSGKKGGSGSVGGSAKKLGQAWTGDEDWALLQYLHPKLSKPDWKSAASTVGRDAKVSAQVP